MLPWFYWISHLKGRRQPQVCVWGRWVIACTPSKMWYPRCPALPFPCSSLIPMQGAKGAQGCCGAVLGDGEATLSLQPGRQICEPSFASAFQPGPGMAARVRDPLEPQTEAAGGCQASASPSWGLCCCWGPRHDQPSTINSSLYYHLLCVAFHLKKGNSL